MMPRGLYELLPYLYIAAGITGGLMIDTSLIMIGSLLLVSAGLLTLYMRFQHRSGRFATEQIAGERRRGDRRRRNVSDFPLVDSAGQLIIADRRIGDRRMRAQGFA